MLFVGVVQAVRQVLQALEHAVHAPADPLGHAALPLPVLRQAVPSEVGHEEAYLHTHRFVFTITLLHISKYLNLKC